MDVLFHDSLLDSGGNLQENPDGVGRGRFEGRMSTDGVSFFSAFHIISII